jgi:hypothetical protein
MSWHHELAAFCVWHCQLFPGALATRSAYPLPANVAEEPRPAAHKCKPGEVELDQRYFGRQPGEAELEDSDPGGGSDGGGGVVASDSDDDVADAGALDDGSDSDVSFSSAELRGRKRRRGAAESDEEVELEEFERKEIMRVGARQRHSLVGSLEVVKEALAGKQPVHHTSTAWPACQGCLWFVCFGRCRLLGSRHSAGR